jgi:hypothetical protein
MAGGMRVPGLTDTMPGRSCRDGRGGERVWCGHPSCWDRGADRPDGESSVGDYQGRSEAPRVDLGDGTRLMARWSPDAQLLAMLVEGETTRAKGHHCTAIRASPAEGS